jgi:hypothetical protein
MTNTTSRRPPGAPRKRPMHRVPFHMNDENNENLSNNNLENVRTVNIYSPNWNISPGNTAVEPIPQNLLAPKRKFTLGPPPKRTKIGGLKRTRRASKRTLRKTK